MGRHTVAVEHCDVLIFLAPLTAAHPPIVVDASDTLNDAGSPLAKLITPSDQLLLG